MAQDAAPAGPVTIRVATFNLEDVRTDDLKDAANARLKALAEVIQRVRPNVILLNEIAFDAAGEQPRVAADPPPSQGAPSDDSSRDGADAARREPAASGQNAQRFADLYLAVPQAEGLAPLRYRAFMAPVNTGSPSGFDLDRNGSVVNTYPTPSPAGPGAVHPPPSDEARAYANDCYGFGTFPGQYGMALLVDERLSVLHGKVRTFQRLPWSYMPGAHLPTKPDGTPWYDEATLKLLRLSSKSFWDVPIHLPNGAVVHALCSHPTPPAFDGPEMRNRKRNHDEIRLIADYIHGEPYIVDDHGIPARLPPGRAFVVLGDLNADPDEGDSFKNPLKTVLAGSGRVRLDPPPRASRAIEGLDDDDTAAFRLRVDYVLPSRELHVERSGVWREGYTIDARAAYPSDHFLVWAEVTVPAPNAP